MLLKGEGSPLCDKESRGNSAMKTNGAAYILWLLGLVGFCGIQRIYTGNYISGVIWFLTLGLLFIGQIIDLFLIPILVRESNRRFAEAVRLAVHR
jgi:TM2 domain-containing membrane protein YozV